QQTIFGTGGSAESELGNGGTVSVTIPGNITVDGTFLVARPLGFNGKGANITLAAGGDRPGALTIKGSLDAGGAGGGAPGLENADGGSVSLTANSATALAVLGGINASSGAVNGNGGSIIVTNSGSGGILVSDPSLMT